MAKAKTTTKKKTARTTSSKASAKKSTGKSTTSKSKTATPKKTVKKEAPKLETTSQAESKEKNAVKTTSTVSTKDVVRNDQKKRWITWGLAGLIVLLAIGYSVRDRFIVARVNGTPIYRSEIVNELESQAGAQVLDRMVVENLILQEAQRQGVVVDEAAIDEEIMQIETQVTTEDQSLDSLLALQGMTREDLREQIRLQKLVEQLQPAPAEPTEEEIAASLEAQAESFPEEMTEEERRDAVIRQLQNQTESQSVENWIQSLKDQATIEYWRVY